MLRSAAVRISPGRAAAAAAALLVLVGCERPPPPVPPAEPAVAPVPGAAPPTAAPGAPTPATSAAPAPSPPEAPAPPAGPPPQAAEPAPDPPAPAPPAPPVELLEAQALIPGAATALSTGEQVTVDPGATFRVVLKGRFPEARLSLLDAADAMLPSAGAREVAGATTVTLQPTAPLKPGAAYRLRLDGATSRELRAADGTLHAPVELHLLAAGAPPPAPKPRPKKQRKRP